ncbi:DUF4199 domain-containing protein [Leeuwenhoekiella polynyae]|nr:DUF4199 domain-containing protein [Leeuwenhoekiella polynyae]
MENTSQPSSKKIMITYGVILAAVSILLSVFSYVMGNVYQPHWSIQLFGFLVLIAVIVYGIIEFKKQNQGYLKLSEGIKIGLGIAAISAVIGVLYFVIFATVIEPNYFENYIEFQRQTAIETNPSMTTEQIEAGLNMSKPFMNVGFFAGIQLIMGLFFGFIVSLIASLAMKKTNPYQE